MTINSLVQTNRPVISELVDSLRSGFLFVDNSFQRRLVWTERQKVRLIETIFLGFPMPEIYLWKQPADPESGAQRSSIVDGQQRITSMRQFVANEWCLKDTYLDKDSREMSFCGKFWKDLDENEKRKFWSYIVSARTIPENVTKEQIQNLFRRLNETDKSLNPQEMRNAEFNGQFIKTSEAIADLAIWRTWNVFSDSQIRRMADIELASAFLIYLRSGVVSDTAASINKIYDLYNDNYEEAELDFEKVRKFLSRCSKYYFTEKITKDFFTKPIHIYTLFVVDDMLSSTNVKKSELGSLLSRFVRTYNSSSADSLIIKYREGSSSRTRSKTSRDARIDSLYDWIIRTN
jgi:Protein of unknown function DUF262